MTATLLAATGALLVVVAVVDAVFTTLAAGSGGGPLTTRLASLTWRAVRAVARGPLAGLLRFGGVLVLLSTVLTWVALLWAGWALVFSASDAAVVGASTGAPASTAARVYYAGYVVFTLGIGDFVPAAGVWQIVTAVATFVGLSVVTLSITYLVSVVSAAVSRRALARDVVLSGSTGQDVVLTHWTGDALSQQLPSTLQSLTTQLLQVTQQHLAYPVLHHFHAADPGSSAPRALAALDDALLLLSAGVAPQARPAGDTLVRAERALEHYAATIGGASADGAELPPLPSLDGLREAGLPTATDDEFAAATVRHERRRRRLQQLVAADAWDWPAPAR